MYKAASTTESILESLLATLQEREIEEQCQKYYDKLFFQNHCMKASISIETIDQLRMDLFELDNHLIDTITTFVNRFAVLMVLFHMLDQKQLKAREFGVFRNITENFKVFCQQKEVQPAIVLVFVIILYNQIQKSECYEAELYGDNIPYGIATLLQMMNLVGGR